jgi:hypothetical protein
MRKANSEPDVPAARRGFPRMRKSRSGGQSLDMELSRLRQLSIEDRMIEALSMRADISGLQPTANDA